MPVTLPDDVAEVVDLVMRTFGAMAKAKTCLSLALSFFSSANTFAATLLGPCFLASRSTL
jgi:hypothetical protein